MRRLGTRAQLSPSAKLDEVLAGFWPRVPPYCCLGSEDLAWRRGRRQGSQATLAYQVSSSSSSPPPPRAEAFFAGSISLANGLTHTHWVRTQNIERGLNLRARTVRETNTNTATAWLPPSPTPAATQTPPTPGSTTASAAARTGHNPAGHLGLGSFDGR
jgi:hypothetical protein